MFRMPLQAKNRFAPVDDGLYYALVAAGHLLAVSNTGQVVLPLPAGHLGGKPELSDFEVPCHFFNCLMMLGVDKPPSAVELV